MKFAILLAFCFIASVYCDAELNLKDNGQYNFLYSTGDAGAHKREETSNADGTVSGSYSYVDANGDLRKVEYKAGGSIGYQPSGDISVDKKTAEKAAEIAALAPKAPAVETPEVKIPASPFTLPLYALPGIHAPLHIAPVPHPVAALPYAYLHHPVHWW
ncbi:adult-specific rigid cuticular protein 12.6 [Nephila pilipes]|uniref:Adult-specific rigid cuticular protein 12.6 n=1 Tax=Nephila pilipes TaxID=299642 RepID=A0A8X6PQ17_NEPPI|nr:adult-specific rigid cuticular protein 12.6 [Nephila pilipes]